MRTQKNLCLTVLLLLAFSGCGGGGSSPPPPPPPPPITVSVTPTQATVKAGASQLFSAIVTGTTNTAVTWQVNGTPGGDATVGTISMSGLYTAPGTIPSPAMVTVTAISQANSAKSGSASVTVVVGVTVAPSSAELLLATAQQFSATVTGIANTNVTWSVSCVTPAGAPSCDPSTIGTVTEIAPGVAQYTAPNAIPDNVLTDINVLDQSGRPELRRLQPAASTISVVAASQQDPTQTASASVFVNAGSQTVNQTVQGTPVSLGTSGGNAKDITGSFCCSGTLGSLVDRNGTKLVLSNNHVLAKRDQATVGDPITQPGLVDTNCQAATTVAKFTQAIKLQNANGMAPADAAIAAVVTMPSPQVDLSGVILQLGTVSGGLAGSAPPASTVAPPVLTMPVAKSGRTSGLSCSKISLIGVTVQVQYQTGCNGGTPFMVTYNNQVDVTSTTFGAPGDSGSLIVDAQTAQPVALLFAGSPTDTVGNPIQTALNALADTATPPHIPTMVGGAQHVVSACTGTTAQPVPGGLPAATPRQIEDAEVQRVLAVKEAHVKELLSIPAVIGVGVGASDTPGEAVIVVFVEKGKKAGAIPAQVDGVRTKVRETEPFRAFTKIPWCPATDKGVASPASSSGSLHQLGFPVMTAGESKARLQSRQHAPCVK